MTRFGLYIGVDRIGLAVVRRGEGAYYIEEALAVGASRRHVMAAMLAAAPRQRFGRLSVSASISPSAVQVRTLDGLPPTKDAATLSRVVREGSARFFLRSARALTVSDVHRDHDGKTWAAAYDRSVIDDLEEVCRQSRATLKAAHPAVVLRAGSSGDGEHRWFDDEIATEATVRERRIVDLRRRRASADEVAVAKENDRRQDAVQAGRAQANGPLSWRPSREIHYIRIKKYIFTSLLMLAGASAAAAWAAPTARILWEAHRVERDLPALERSRATVALADYQLGAVSAELQQIGAFTNGRRSALSILGELAMALPESTAVVAFHVDSVGGTFTALAPNVVEVVPALSDAPEIVAPRITGSMSREPVAGVVLERAAVRFRLSGVPVAVSHPRGAHP